MDSDCSWLQHIPRL